MKILIIRFSSIGDILLTTPFVRQARKKFPDAQIDYVIKEKFSELIKYNSNINNCIELAESSGKDFDNLVTRVKQNEYQYVFDLHNNIRSNRLRFAVKAENKYHITKNKFNQKILLWFKKNRYDHIKTIPERYFDVGKKAGITDGGGGLEINWPDSLPEKVLRRMKQSGADMSRPAIGLAPGAGFFTKRWPVEYFSELIGMLTAQYEVFLFGGNQETEIAEALIKRHKINNLIGKFTVLESGAALSYMKLLISNDSGMMHMATAVKTPVVAIFGSSVKEFGFFPYRSKSIVVENKEISCRPCSHIGRKTCPKNHFRCMMDITPKNVYESAMGLL